MTDEPIQETERGVKEGQLDEATAAALEEVAELEEQMTEVEGQVEEVEEHLGELEAIKAELEAASAQAAEYLDGWQRARAEFLNYRRRQEQQLRQVETNAQARLLAQLLPAIDDLGRALGNVPPELRDHPWVAGLSLIEQKWLAALDKAGVSAISAEPGRPFDPNYHEALTHEPSAEHPAGTVIEVLQRGYQLRDTVLRPALVRVSSGE